MGSGVAFSAFVICLGACVGAMARWRLGVWLNAIEILPGTLLPLGTLTTFSSFSAEVVMMLTQQRYVLAMSTIGVHLIGSLSLTMAGIWSASLFLTRQ